MRPFVKLRWATVYGEEELYKAALRVYTKSLFQWRKSLAESWDGRSLYDFARHGLKHLETIHRKLAAGRFAFRPGAARTVNFNGKQRTLYIYPWEEKIVDLLLYRLLNTHLREQFSPASYAYRTQSHGVDLCQSRIGRLIAHAPQPLFAFKRDIARYFDSIDHGLLRAQLTTWIEPDDYLYRLLEARIGFEFYTADGNATRATVGVPFGTPVACAFANLHLTGLDHTLTSFAGLHYFRYADDLLGLSTDAGVVERAAAECDRQLAALRLEVKPSHHAMYSLAEQPVAVGPFQPVKRFKHLGLEFRANGRTGLSRDKARKIRNIFRYAFRRKAGRLRRLTQPERRAALAVEVADNALLEGLRNVAIIDYYLKHVRDEAQLRELDRWLAEEVLAIAFQNGHRKGNFRRLSYARLREMGLPSLAHRARLIQHGEVATSFLRWKEYQQSKRNRGGMAPGAAATQCLLPEPSSSRKQTLVGESDGLSMGGMEVRFAEANLSLSGHSPVDSGKESQHGTV